MNNAPEIKDIDKDLLTEPVRQTLDDPTAKIVDWEHVPVRYINTEKSNLGLHRFQGTAEVHSEIRPWSIVLKAVHAPVNDAEPTYWNYHRREILIYQSDLLTDLPNGLSAPRCLGITEYAGDICWLWLENAAGISKTWSLAEYSQAARALGRFNGAYLIGRPLPIRSWLSKNWVHGWLNEYQQGCLNTVKLMDDENFWNHPLLKSSFPRPIQKDVLRLWDNHASLLYVLDQLPQTFCHMDAYRPNLFIRQDDQTIAIDWVFTGIGGIGEEIANLFAASLIWFEYDAADAIGLDQAVFNGYVNGLRDAGWQGNPQLARLGYTTACALRWGVIGLWWLLSLGDASEEALFEKEWGRPMSELVPQFAKTAYHVLDLADEAYQLQQALF